jgi:rhodanese-related sulfurtransferase/DNA-binding transcriptional ArsR family regulator
MLRNSDFQQQLSEQFARIGKTLSNGHRISLLHYLGQSERSVESLAKTIGLSIASTSQHLQHLRNAGLVSSRKEGQRVFYRLADDQRVLGMLRSLQNVAIHLLADVRHLVRDFAGDDSQLKPVSFDELQHNIKAGHVVVLDVRPVEEYEFGHLPGAINIPLPELEMRLHELPHDVEIVAYCRGPYCLLSNEAVIRLREHQRQARRMQDGFQEWKLAGLPIEGTSAI